jgi:hypothetical protein
MARSLRRHEMSRELAEELVRMAEEDRAVRAALATGGSLFDDYHPMMAELHRRNAERLNEIMDAVGWPGRELIGGASWAPMMVLQHAIGSPKVMRRGLGLLRAAERRGEVDPAVVAMLEDRILVLEGKPQQYGTQVDWDDDGGLNPFLIANPEDVDERRRAVGLGPLAEDLKRIRADARNDGERSPVDLAARRATAEAWARSVGWRD